MIFLGETGKYYICYVYFSQEYNIPGGGMQIYFIPFNGNLTNIKRKCLTNREKSGIVAIPVNRGLFVVRIFTVFDARSPSPTSGHREANKAESPP